MPVPLKTNNTDFFKNNYDKNQLVKDQEMLAKYTNNAGWLAIEKAKEGIDEAASRICRADQEQYDIDVYDCADLVNIKQHPVLLREVDQKNPIWFDASLDNLLSAYRALGGGYKSLGQLLAEKKDTERESLQLYLKAIETYRKGVSQDPKEETIDIKFIIIICQNKKVIVLGDFNIAPNKVDSYDQNLRVTLYPHLRPTFPGFSESICR